MSDQGDTPRQRTVTWHDPTITATAFHDLTGLEFLRRITRGELPPPPIASLLGMRFEEMGEGRVVFSVEPAEYHYNPIGTVHGGLACTLLDSAMSCAVQSLLPAGVAYTTLELKVNFVRPMSQTTGKVLCEGKVIHLGSRIGTAEGRLYDEHGKLYAHGVTTCIVLRHHEPRR